MQTTRFRRLRKAGAARTVRLLLWSLAGASCLAGGSRRMFEDLLKFFVVMFVVVDPPALAPIFAGLTEGASRQYQRRMA